MQEQVDERVSVRFDTPTLEEIDRWVKLHGYMNRSEFLRQAARALLDAQKMENTITVELPPLLKNFIEAMADRGQFTSAPDALRTVIENHFTNERIKNIAEASGTMEVATGRKVDAKIEKSNSREIVRP